MPLTNEQMHYLNFLEQEWVLNGALPSFDKARSKLVWLTNGFVEGCYADGTFRNALTARGITPPPIDATEQPILTRRQIAAIRAIYDPQDNRSDKRKLDDLKISTQEWNGWKKDPIFADALAKLTDSIFNDNLDEVYRAIVDQARGGDISASKLILEITGRWSPRQGDVDVARLVQVFIESVSRHVSDPHTLEAIASDLMSITGTLGASVGQHALRKSVRGELAHGA